jgi:hypothetical protein
MREEEMSARIKGTREVKREEKIRRNKKRGREVQTRKGRGS